MMESCFRPAHLMVETAGTNNTRNTCFANWRLTDPAGVCDDEFHVPRCLKTAFVRDNFLVRKKRDNKRIRRANNIVGESSEEEEEEAEEE